MPDTYAVVGGEGFLGHALVLALRQRYPSAKVVSLDIVQRHFPEKDQWAFANCDLTILEDVTRVFNEHKVSTVLHTASPWIGASKAVCEKVNVGGTTNVVEACKATGVRKLVYTSSGGVVFDGRDVINVDERCTAPESSGQDDVYAYNISKARAEAVVLAANDKDGLLTCALRAAGIFGIGDRQNVPGWLAAYKAGKTKFQMGDNTNLCDWTYIDNIVYAHLLAAEKLGTSVPVTVFAERIAPVSASLPRRSIPSTVTAPLSRDDSEKHTHDINPPIPAKRNRYDQWFGFVADPSSGETDQLPIAGEAYYIAQGEPVPFWSWGTSIWYAYSGWDRPMRTLAPSIGLAYATVENLVCKLLGRPSSIPKSAIRLSFISRYYNIEKARRMLGYEPQVGLVEGLNRTMKWYKENEASISAPEYKS